MSAYGKATWGTISGYNSYFSTYFSGDVDIFPQISIDVSGNATKVGTGDLVIRSGNLYMSSSGFINAVPVTNLNYISTLSGLLNSLSGIVSSSSVTSLSGIVNSLSGTVYGHTTQINTISSLVNSLSGTVSSSSVTSLSGIVYGHTTQITTISGIVYGHTTQITTISSLVASHTNQFSNYTLSSSLTNYALSSSLANYALSSSLANYALSSSLANYALTSNLINYQPQINTISSLVASHTNQFPNYTLSSSLATYAPLNVLQNYSLSSAVVSAGSTFSDGIKMTNGEFVSPSFQTSQGNYTVQLGYYTGTVGYIQGLQNYQLYSFDNKSSLFATVRPASSYIGNITLTTPVAVQMVSQYIQKGLKSIAWNLSTSAITYTAKIYKNVSTVSDSTIPWKTISTETKVNTSPAKTYASFSGTLSATSTYVAPYTTIDYGRYIGFASISFIPDYNSTGSDEYKIYLTFTIPSPYYVSITTNILTTTTFNAVQIIYNFQGGTATSFGFIQFTNAIHFQLYPSTYYSNTNIVNSIIPLNGPVPTSSYVYVSGFKATDEPILLTGLSGLIACKNLAVSNNIYLGGTTKTIAVSVAKTIVAGTPIAKLSLAQPLGMASSQYTITASVSTDTTSIVTPSYMLTSDTTISSAIDYTFNSKYDENCYVDGFLVVNNITNLGTNIITGDLVLNSTLSGALYNSLYCYNVAQFYSQLVIYDTTQSVGTGTGALQVLGGVSIYKDVYIGGNLQLNAGNLTVAFNSTVYGNHTILNTTPSTSTTTGALVCNGGVGISGDVNMSGSLTVNTNFILIGDIIQTTGYYLSQFYTKDEQESVSVTTGSIVGLGGCGISKNMTVGGNINTSVTLAPASVNSLGYQTTTSTSTNQSLTTSTYFNLLNFAVTSANYGTYMMEFSCQIKTSTTTALTYYLVLYTSTSFTLSSSTMSYALNTIVNNNATNGIILKFSRVFSCYTPMTIYAMPRVDFTGTATVMSSNLTATRIA